MGRSGRAEHSNGIPRIKSTCTCERELRGGYSIRVKGGGTGESSLTFDKTVRNFLRSVRFCRMGLCQPVVHLVRIWKSLSHG